MDGEPSPAVATEVSGPPSPGVSPVRLADGMEELVRFTLAAAGEGLDDCDVLLSRDYCIHLLQDESNPTDPHLNVYPLYKHLARAIEQCINSGTFRRTTNSVVSVPLDESLKMRENEWSKLILDKGSELLKMFKAVEFELHVQEPFFSQLRAGLKTVEGRCATGDYNRITPGSLLLFNKCLLFEVQDVRWYSSFSEMLQEETLAKVLPGVKTIEEGVKIYRKFYSEEKEKSKGVLAISVSKVASQPYISMANLLSGLSYDGVGSLLGMRHTVGTVLDALPPPRSFLISSSMNPHRPNVKGCSLTDAARALAKHVNRSSDGWWGDFYGSDSKKNTLALEVINRLLTNCCWMNVHLIKPYDCVFEIRVSEGYGARWSKDGSKFIGFLEPYTEEGFAKGWKC
ncbi:uncharacterized protein LOC103708581 isoform X2 [Phoenix dactylifera]|uniref:Uncharacterized protein LOC103708581 isoform X2 n=1 Tax=Phoenix dactylifera TaxID=42345 RepID=A0A8B8J5G1_PHODC|nr:uncharacterized protein LOC103708581 isoform X2 [Phoenix dactylifera]